MESLPHGPDGFPLSRPDRLFAAHLLLGVAIETVTGRRYEDYCAAAVLRPQGVRDATRALFSA